MRAGAKRDTMIWAWGRDGNGYIPVRYWPPIPIPARTKFYPSGYPYPYTGRKMLPYPYPTGNLYPTGNPHPKAYPRMRGDGSFRFDIRG